MVRSACFDIFERCVDAMSNGDLIESISDRDKEFHFQNWFQKRLEESGMYYEPSGRNVYPDFRMVNSAEGFEVKALAWPGRDRNLDTNSQLPSGYHNGRQIFYVFGRYPADLTPYAKLESGQRQYPVIDLVICHGDFLNADHDYVHKNRSVRAFGSYGDILIRDRKMYVAPTPFVLTEGTTGLATLIIPEELPLDNRFQEVGKLVRVEADELIVGYRYDLKTTELTAEKMPNPRAGTQHCFIACRLKSQASKPVLMATDYQATDSAD